MSQKEFGPPKIPLYLKVRIIGGTACFCYFSVVSLLAIFNGPDIFDDLKKSGFLYVLGLLALGSGLLSLVAHRNKKKSHAS